MLKVHSREEEDVWLFFVAIYSTTFERDKRKVVAEEQLFEKLRRRTADLLQQCAVIKLYLALFDCHKRNVSLFFF